MKVILGECEVVQIDEEDLHFLQVPGWGVYENKEGELSVINSRTKQMLHRLVLGVTDPTILVDHIFGDRLDNRKQNLRIATNRLNSQNTKAYREGTRLSQYIGVTKSRKKWRARTWVKEKGHICIGSFELEIDAAKAYDQYMIANFPINLRGLLNFPENTP